MRLLDTPEYDFLRTNPRLGKNIIFLTYGGSYAYGTNVEGSDIDIRGCTKNSRSDILGLSNFEQVVDNQTDTTVYSFNKFIKLLTNCNPNVIEMLGCKPEHYFVMTSLGRELISKRKMFLTQRAAASFGGYAISQLRRLENALARDSYPAAEKERHIMGSCESAMFTFPDRFKSFSSEQIKLHVEEAQGEAQILADVHMDNVPLREFSAMIGELNNVAKEYDKLNHRNRKKDDTHLNKHAMHLIRLYLMCIDIFEKEEIITYREADHDLLMAIRSGKYQREDHSFSPEFYDLLHGLEQRLDYAKENTSLPQKPNMKLIEEFVMYVNEMVIHDEL